MVLLQPGEDPPVRDRAGRHQVEDVDAAGRSVVVVEPAAHRIDHRPVADGTAAIHRLRHGVGAEPGQPIQRSGRLLLRIVHGAEPQPPGRVDIAVIQPVAVEHRLDAVQRAEPAVGRIEAAQPVLEPAQISAALDRHDEGGSGRRRPARPFAGPGHQPVDASTEDVDEIQRRLGLRPDRTLAELRLQVPDALGFGNAFMSHLLHARALQPIAADAEPEFHHP